MLDFAHKQLLSSLSTGSKFFRAEALDAKSQLACTADCKIDLAFAEHVRSWIVRHELANQRPVRRQGDEGKCCNALRPNCLFEMFGEIRVSTSSTQIGSRSFTSGAHGE